MCSVEARCDVPPAVHTYSASKDRTNSSGMMDTAEGPQGSTTQACVEGPPLYTDHPTTCQVQGVTGTTPDCKLPLLAAKIGDLGTPDVLIDVVPDQKMDRTTLTDAPVGHWGWFNTIFATASIFFCQILGVIATVTSIHGYIDHYRGDASAARNKRAFAYALGAAAIVVFVLSELIVIVGSYLYYGYSYGYYT